MTRGAWYFVIFCVAFILLDELAYFWWRRRNPGSEWSHIDPQGTYQLQNYPVITTKE